MFYCDKPIESIENDLLKRNTFSKKLAKAIFSYSDSDKITIGLYGKWGSGKSSILNMIKNEIKELSITLPADNRPIIINFNPWIYSNSNQLLSQFFKTILAQLNEDTGNRKLKIIGEVIEKYSSVLDYTKYIPVVGEYLEPIKSLVSNFGDHISEVADSNISLEKQKEIVIESLKEHKQRIIIIIDDIDRLNNEQIIEVFRLVNSLADFPYMMYILSFDKEIVSRALSKEQNCNGEEYLEKIIQVPFEIPVASKATILEIFNNKIIDIVGKELFDYEQKYYNKVLHNCITLFVNNIRDVNRIINIFRFKYGIMKEETNWIDMLAITIIQINSSGVYNWIVDNIEFISGSTKDAHVADTKEVEKIKKIYLEELSELYPINPEYMLTALQTLFPKFSLQSGGWEVSLETDSELRYKQRIACRDKAKLYFSLSFDDVDIPQKVIIDTIYMYSAKELRVRFNTLIERDLILDYLLEIHAHLKDIPENRILLFFEEFLNLRIKLEDSIKDKKYASKVVMYCQQSICDIFKIVKPSVRFIVLRDLIVDANEELLAVYAELVLKIFKSYGNFGGMLNEEYKLIDEKELNIIRSEILIKFMGTFSKDNLFKTKLYRAVLELWEKLDFTSFSNVVTESLRIPGNIVKYLTSICGVWLVKDSSGWVFKESDLKYISKNLARRQLEIYVNSDEFKSLPDEQKKITIAFLIWSAATKDKLEPISEKDVDKVLYGDEDIL